METTRLSSEGQVIIPKSGRRSHAGRFATFDTKLIKGGKGLGDHPVGGVGY